MADSVGRLRPGKNELSEDQPLEGEPSSDGAEGQRNKSVWAYGGSVRAEAGTIGGEHGKNDEHSVSYRHQWQRGRDLSTVKRTGTP